MDSPEGKVAFGQVPYLHGAENTMQPSSSIALIVSIIVIKTMVLSSVFGGNFHHADGHPKQFWLKHFGAQAFILTDSIMGDVLLQRRKLVQTLRGRIFSGGDLPEIALRRDKSSTRPL